MNDDLTKMRQATAQVSINCSIPILLNCFTQTFLYLSLTLFCSSVSQNRKNYKLYSTAHQTCGWHIKRIMDLDIWLIFPTIHCQCVKSAIFSPPVSCLKLVLFFIFIFFVRRFWHLKSSWEISIRLHKKLLKIGNIWVCVSSWFSRHTDNAW